MYASALDDKHTIVTVPRSRLHSSASQRLRTDRPHPNRHAHARTNPLPSLLSPLPLSSPFLPPFLPLPFPLPPSTPPLPSSGPARGITVCVARPRTAAAGGATTTTKSAVSRAERNQCSAGAERGWGGKKGAALAFYGPAADGERRTRRSARQAMPAPHQERLRGGEGMSLHGPADVPPPGPARARPGTTWEQQPAATVYHPCRRKDGACQSVQ